MIVRRKATKDGDYDADPLDRVKSVLYILIIAAGIMWLAPLLFGEGPGDGGETAPTEPSGALATEIVAGIDDAKSVILAAIDAAKYALMAAALVVISILRVRIAPKTSR